MTNYFTDYDVLTEDEALNLLPEGEYEGWIRRVEVKASKSDPAKKHVILTVDVYDQNQMPHSITQGCYLRHLLRHACEATGCLENFENKTLILDEHLKGKEVIAVVGRQKEQNGFPAKNVIKDYKSPKKSTPQQDSFNDEIKF